MFESSISKTTFNPRASSPDSGGLFWLWPLPILDRWRRSSDGVRASSALCRDHTDQGRWGEVSLCCGCRCVDRKPLPTVLPVAEVAVSQVRYNGRIGLSVFS